MKEFARLFDRIDQTTSLIEKIGAMTEYFTSATPEDAAWALYFLSGRRSKRLLPTKILREAVKRNAQLSDWLFEECYAAVGDLAETIALLVPSGTSDARGSLASWIEERVLPLRDFAPEEQIEHLLAVWKELPSREIFLFNKLVTGGFRAGVSHGLVVKSLAKLTRHTESLIVHRLMGEWPPTPSFFRSLFDAETAGTQDVGTPYPFALASPLEGEAGELGDIGEWCLEWKWDGIRAQIVRRDGVFVWSRGEELVGERFPEIVECAARLPRGCVIDGELLAFRDGEVKPFALLQQRIGRKKLTAKILEDVPVSFVAFDLLEMDGHDLRELPLSERRRRLETLLAPFGPRLSVSPRVEVISWGEAAGERQKARTRSVEGLMIKRWSSTYRTGRRRGDWWKWKIEPHTMDAVLLYAQAGHGRRATLYTDYTFGVWRGSELVPIAKAYSGLTDKEILELDRWIRGHTIERFGPVRSVPPTHVFELAFEAIQPSSRHKSGFAVRFPRILRRRTDKTPEEADNVDRLSELCRVVD